MKTPRALILTAFVTAGFASSGFAELAKPASTYQVTGTFQVGGPGGWDYVTVDAANQLLYVPRSTHTQVIKADTGAVVADIPGQKRNHGVAVVPSAHRGFITDGGDATVTIFDLRTNQVLGKVKVLEDADGIAYDAVTDKVLLVCGDASAMVVLSPGVDPINGKPDAVIDLGGKPESFIVDGHGKAYVDLEDKDAIAVVDLKTQKVEARWPTTPGGSPVGLAIDGAHRRLFIGCRKPQNMVVMDCDTGKVLGVTPIGRGVDACGFDDGFGFASCGDGTLSVVGEDAPGHFATVQSVATRPGARTSAVDPLTHTVYLPTAEFFPAEGKARPKAKPGTFMIVKVGRAS